MAICKICGMQVIAGEVYHTDCIGAEMDKARMKNEELLNAAINDIPHVGNYCAHLDENNMCSLVDQLCCRRIHTDCPDWKWRGLRE